MLHGQSGAMQQQERQQSQLPWLFGRAREIQIEHRNAYREDDSDGMSSVTDTVVSISINHISDNSNSVLETNDNNDQSQENDDRSVLFGRSHHISVLRDAWKRVCCCEGGSSEIVLIYGKSGTGKTVLVESTLRRHVSNRNGCFVSGKYDQLQHTGESFSALVAALTDLCDLLVSNSSAATTMSTPSSSSQQRQQQKEQHEQQTEPKEQQNDGDNNNNASIHHLARTLRQQLGSEAPILTSLIPNLSYLLPELANNPNEHMCGKDDHHQLPSQKKQAFTRLTQLCCVFLRTVATCYGPVVLFLDDLQWADDASVQILEAIASDLESRHLLLIGAFRDGDDEDEGDTDEEVSHTTPATSKTKTANSERILALLQAVKTQAVSDDGTSPFLPCTSLQLKNLDAQSIQEIVSRVTGMPIDDKCRELCKVILQKTHGNAYFVFQFLEKLQREGMLIRVASQKWDWDLEQIQSKTDVSENVVNLVGRKIKGLSSSLQHALKLACFLGFQFQLDLLHLLVNSENEYHQSLSARYDEADLPPEGLSRAELTALLDEAVHEGLLEKNGEISYKFSHDRVQCCLLEMVPEGKERETLHFRIGRLLFRERDQRLRTESSSKSKREPISQAMALRLLILATDHLNLGSALMSKSQDIVALAKLNLNAGKCALQQYAFSRSAGYMRKALFLLAEDAGPTGKWTRHYQMCLDIVTALVYLEFCEGEASQRVHHLCLDLFTHARCMKDKLKLYNIMIVGLGAQDGQLPDAVRLGVSVLNELGVKMPHRPKLWHLIREMSRLKRLLRGKSDDDLLSLDTMQDENTIAAIQVMTTMSYAVHLDEESRPVFAVLALRMMSLTCRYGHSEWSPLAFAQYGALQSVLGNLVEARRFLGLTVEMIQRSSSNAAKARALATLHGMVSQWSEPYTAAIDGFQKCYTLGMDCGDIDIALYGGNQYVYVATYTAIPLSQLDVEMRIFYQKMKDFHLDAAILLTLPMWQMIQNYIGENDDPAELSGKIIDHEEFQMDLDQGTNLLATQVLQHIRLHMAIVFNSVDLMMDVLPKVSKGRDKALRGHVSIYACIFIEGLVAYRLFQHTNQRKYRRSARWCTKTLERWARNGVVNCRPIALMLQAERAIFAADDRTTSAQAAMLYDKAIKLAGEMEIIQWEAMFNDRAFHVLLHHFADRPRALPYLRRATDLYVSWEAYGKVEAIHERYHSLLQTAQA